MTTINWHMLSKNDKLEEWKNLRESIVENSPNDQLQAIVEFFSTVPFGASTIDCYNPKSWPSPWEIIFYGSFCKSSISLLIFYTLKLLSVKSNIELHLIDDDGEIYLLPVIDNTFVLNYEHNKISSYSTVSNRFQTLLKYTHTDINEID